MTDIPATDTQAVPEIEALILSLTAARGLGKSICPSEVARALQPAHPSHHGWQSRLTDVRRAASRLALAGRIEILRKGQPIDPGAVKGVIRLRQAAPPAGDA